MFNNVYRTLYKIYELMKVRTDESQRQLIAFGLIMSINYPIYFLIWYIADVQSYQNLPLRLTASLMCLSLVFNKRWPRFIQKYLPIYWYFTACFCLPFFFTFMMLKNDMSTLWLMNYMSILFFLILLFDVLSSCILFSLGLSFGWLAYSITTQSPLQYVPGTISLSGVIATIIPAFFIGGIFKHNKDKIENEKANAIFATGASIAHELRTPLGAIQSSINGIQRYYDILVDAYAKALGANLSVGYIHPQHFQTLTILLEDATAEIQYSNTIIDMLLIKAGHVKLTSLDFTICRISDCIHELIKRYPFCSEMQRELVIWDDAKDFVFKGKQLLMVHVLFNLLKNALYYITAVGKGQITIKVSETNGYNNLHFKDTAKGIPAEHMSKLFTRFFTTSHNGTGLGLAFCKMVMYSFGGNITCNSREDEYAEFVMSFPKVVDRELSLAETALAS